MDRKGFSNGHFALKSVKCWLFRFYAKLPFMNLEPTKILDGTSDDPKRIFVSKSVCPVDKVNCKGELTSSKIQNLFNI